MIYESPPAVIVATCRHFPFREQPRHDVAWHRVTRFLCLFSRFFNAYTRAIANANINYCERWSESSSETQTKKSSHDPLEIISAASRATSFADRSSADLSPILFSHYTRTFFLSRPLFLPLPPSILRSEPAAYVLVTAPRSTHAAAMLGFLRSSDRSHFFAATASFLPSPHPLLREPTAVLFLIYIFAVRSHLRSFASPPSRSSLLLSISLNLLRSETTCLSHGKISIVRRDIARTEMSCRRCRELASSFDRYTW